jgi:hypothetical protein
MLFRSARGVQGLKQESREMIEPAARAGRAGDRGKARTRQFFERLHFPAIAIEVALVCHEKRGKVDSPWRNSVRGPADRWRINPRGAPGFPEFTNL